MDQTMSPTDEVIGNLLSKLTLEEKIFLLSGADTWHTLEIPRLGIGSIKTTDGPSDAHGKYAIDRTTAAFMPSPVCQAATRSRSHMRDLGRLLCREAKTKSAHVLLAPTICCARNPLDGRNFECFGEDPFLSGSLAIEYVEGVQETGEVAATPKHFIANEQEFERFSIDAEISEQALREIYLRPFEMVVRSAKPECLMTSYNSINGHHADMSTRLIKDILRGEWGFSGLVMSDWGGTNSTGESLAAGLDLEMPGPPEQRGKKLLKLVEEASPEDSITLIKDIDASAAKVLTLAQKHGLLGMTPEDARRSRDSKESSSTTAEDIKLLRRIAASGIVLLKNDKDTLPLVPSILHGKQVAFIGPNALRGTPGGGGSASMNPQYLSHPMESFKAAAKQLDVDVSVKYALGAIGRKWLPPWSGDQWYIASATRGSEKSLLQIDFFASRDLTGTVVETQNRGISILDLADTAPLAFQVDPVPLYSYRISTTVTPQTTGTHSFSISSIGDSVLYVNGNVVVDNRGWKERGEIFYSFSSLEVIDILHLEAGKQYKVTVEGISREYPHDDANAHFMAHPSIRLGFEEELKSRETLA